MWGLVAVTLVLGLLAVGGRDNVVEEHGVDVHALVRVDDLRGGRRAIPGRAFAELVFQVQPLALGPEDLAGVLLAGDTVSAVIGLGLGLIHAETA